jgi:hypothetical protein
MLRELKVIEQRYRAVLEVLDGTPVTEVAERFGVTRRVSVRGAIMIGCQRIQVGLPHAGKTAEVPWNPTLTRSPLSPASLSPRRTTSRDIRRHKASNYSHDR